MNTSVMQAENSTFDVFETKLGRMITEIAEELNYPITRRTQNVRPVTTREIEKSKLSNAAETIKPEIFNVFDTKLGRMIIKIGEELNHPIVRFTSKERPAVKRVTEQWSEQDTTITIKPEVIDAIKNKDANTIWDIIHRNASKAYEVWLRDVWQFNRGIHNSNHYTTSDTVATENNVATVIEDEMNIIEYAVDKMEQPANPDIASCIEDTVRKLQLFPMGAFFGFSEASVEHTLYVECFLHKDCLLPATIMCFQNGWRFKCSICESGVAYDLIGVIQELQKVDFIEAIDFIKHSLNIGFTEWQKEMRRRIDRNCTLLQDSGLLNSYPGWFQTHLPKLEMLLRYAKKVISYHKDLETNSSKLFFYGSYRKLAEEMRGMRKAHMGCRGTCTGCMHQRSRSCFMWGYNSEESVRNILNLLTCFGFIRKVNVDYLPSSYDTLIKKVHKRHTMWYEVLDIRQDTLINATIAFRKLKKSGLFTGTYSRDSLIEADCKKSADKVYVQDIKRKRSNRYEFFRKKYAEAVQRIVGEKGYATNLSVINRIKTDEHKQPYKPRQKERLSKLIVREQLLKSMDLVETTVNKGIKKQLGIELCSAKKVIIPSALLGS